MHSEVWDDVKVASILKSKGQAMLDSQRLIKEQFQVSAVDLSLLTSKMVDAFEVGNYHRTINPLMGIDEWLRIVGQSLDICNPLSSTLSIGDKLLSQEDYELAIKMKNEIAIQEMKVKVAYQATKVTSLTKELATTTTELTTLKQDYNKLIADIGNVDLATISKQLSALEHQTETIIANLAEIANSVLALDDFKKEQNALNTKQENANKDFEKRISTLERKGDDKNDG